MICKECGNEIMSGTLFCTNCGAKAEVTAQEADSDKTVVLWDEEPQQPKQDDDRTVVLWDEEPQQPKQDDDRTVVLWDEEPQQPVQDSGVPKCCPNCGSNNAGDALFCVECGALMSDTKPQPPISPVAPPPIMPTTPAPQPQMEIPPMQQGKPKKEKAPKQPKAPKHEGEASSNKKLPIIIGAAAAAVVVIVGAIFVISGLTSKSGGRDLIYLKDNEVYMAQGGSFKPELITDSFYDDADDADYVSVYSSENSKIQYTDDGSYLFYAQDIEGGEYDLYYKKAGSKEEGTKLESGIDSYQAYSKDMIFYEKGDKLYLANFKDKEKIASDIAGYGVSDDRKYFFWSEYDDGEYDYYIQDINRKKDELKIKEVTSIVSMSDNYDEIYYMSEDTLYLMKNRKDKVKIASDVAKVYMVGEGDSKKLYYFTLEDDEAYTCAEFVKNDVDEGSEYSDYAEYVLEDLEYYNVNLLEYKVYSYSASSDKSEEITSFTGQINRAITSYGAEERIVMYCDVDVEAVDKVKLSEILDKFYINYSDISIEEMIEGNLLEQASFYLLTGDGMVTVSGMEEFYKKPGEVGTESFCLNSKTEEIYMSVYYYEEDGNTYDLYVIPYTEKEAECKLITNDLYHGNLTKAENGVYYVCDVDKDGDGGTLFLNGIEIDEDVYPNSWNTFEDNIYYIKDINSDHDEGTLCKNKAGKVIEIAEDVAVANFVTIKDGNVAYLQNYSFKKSKGDLFVFAGRKSIAVDTDVAAILY